MNAATKPAKKIIETYCPGCDIVHVDHACRYRNGEVARQRDARERRLEKMDGER
jgi:hypothetical protein